MTTNLAKLYHRSLSGVLTLFSVSGTLLTFPAMASGWVRVKTDAQNNIYYVDISAIEENGRFRSFWSHVIHGEPYREAGKLVYSRTFYISVDCQTQSYQVRFERSLDANGQAIQDYDYGDEGESGTPVPNSPEEASIKFVCSK
ncbi:MAG TPA: hypothetical protein DDZ80_23745 [Cyanobacteria bacterium UBA8803]|nr:hypothetical protein [Cyanobacteria bacterium UBA9273]HBL61333.1 hypothetical protein [Cyanobacteria bacterium UBA8803]